MPSISCNRNSDEYFILLQKHKQFITLQDREWEDAGGKACWYAGEAKQLSSVTLKQGFFRWKHGKMKFVE